ncbi:FecR domain-containing protein [Methylophilus sp.]|uniref:FecR domain-containing protein n=1 Tax=Methylophilus sp. TaxID=29541 RepID=UPI0040374382
MINRSRSVAVAPEHDSQSDALQQAAEWFALLRSEQADAADHAGWKVWLDAHSAHQAAWLQVESIKTTFDSLARSGHPHAAKAALLKPTDATRRQALKLLGLAGLTLCTGAMVKRYSPWRDWVTDLAASHINYRVNVGQARLFTLPEGSRLWLNTDSQAQVSYSLALRRITLLGGELLVNTARETPLFDRPLVVDTGHGRMMALGTRFTVMLNRHETYIAVYEGAVTIQTAGSGQRQLVSAGEQCRFNAQAIQALQPAEKAREAWTRGILLADDKRLDDFVAEVSRYRQGTITVAPDIAHLRIMGAFPASDTDAILTSLTETMAVKIQRYGSADIRLVKK